MDTLYGVTYKGRPLQSYINSMSSEWGIQRELILEDLKKTMSNQPTRIQQLESYLSSFRHELELGALQWLDTGVSYKEAPVDRIEEQDVLIKEDADQLG